MEFRPLAAKVTANGSSAKTSVSNAEVVYCLATAAATVTNDDTSASFQMGANQAVVIHKGRFEKIYASSANVHFTKIAYPRG